MQITTPRKRTLSDYRDWYMKSLHNFELYKQSSGVYDLADCLLTLNALPEWIIESENASDDLKNIAKEKIKIMKGDGFQFDEHKLDNIDHKLRFVRIFCNFSKHAVAKDRFPKIEMSFTFPATLPAIFKDISIGDIRYEAKIILEEVLNFWSKSGVEIHHD